MRYDKPIYFQSFISGTYDPDSGNYNPDTVTEEKVYANVTDSATQTLYLIYGQIRQGTKTIRLQNYYDGLYEYIRIDEKRYAVDYSRSFLRGQVFVVSEVQ